MTARQPVERTPVVTARNTRKPDQQGLLRTETESWRETSLPESPRERLRLIADLREDDPDAVPLLCRFLADDDPEVRRASAEALGRIGDPRAVGPLRKALTHGLSLKTHRKHNQATRVGMVLLVLIVCLQLYLLRDSFPILRASSLFSLLFTQVFMVVCGWQDRRKLIFARRAAVESLVRITEHHATAEVQQALPELRAMAASPLMYDRETRRISHEAARRIEDLTAHIRTLPVPAAPQPTEPEALPLPVESAPEPDVASLPRVSEGT